MASRRQRSCDHQLRLNEHESFRRLDDVVDAQLLALVVGDLAVHGDVLQLLELRADVALEPFSERVGEVPDCRADQAAVDGVADDEEHALG
ncbi:hypothetical protein [Candidatus Poriferisodalis sp.]|uniref:hypothetical protein n=1 Tax=Candidatus Poriferisodalis sp. TaxID=3101277 RepID=UPI003D0A38DA